ncbi:MAG: 50S ribosomal protein L11 [Candidatus Nanosalina sp.]
MGDKTTISTLVEGGSASAGPPLGPELGPLPVDIGDVVAEINEKTSEFSGQEVPVDVEVDEDTGDFSVEVGKPPAAGLIKDELGIKSGAAEPNREKVGELSLEQIAQVARMKASDLVAKDLRGAIKEIAGTAQSMGVKVDGKDAYDFQQDVDEGKYDDRIEAEESLN